METHKVFDIVILMFFTFPFACLALIQIRKQLKHGYIKALGQKFDSFDKTVFKIAGVSLAISIVLLIIRMKIVN